MSKEVQRPVMIGVIGTLNAIGGSVLMMAAFGASHGDEGVVMFGAGLVGLITGIGLLQLQPWARIVAIVGYSANLVAGVVLGSGPVILISSLILAYLYSVKVKNAFTTQSVMAAPHVTEPLQEEKPAA